MWHWFWFLQCSLVDGEHRDVDSLRPPRSVGRHPGIVAEHWRGQRYLTVTHRMTTGLAPRHSGAKFATM